MAYDFNRRRREVAFRELLSDNEWIIEKLTYVRLEHPQMWNLEDNEYFKKNEALFNEKYEKLIKDIKEINKLKYGKFEPINKFYEISGKENKKFINHNRDVINMIGIWALEYQKQN